MKKITVLTLALFMLGLSACSNSDKKTPQQDSNKGILELRSEFMEMLKNPPAKIAVAFRELGPDMNQTILINEKEKFHAASLMKVPVLVEMYHQSALEHKFSLDDEIVVKNSFKSIVDQSPYSLTVEDDSYPELYDKVGEKMSIRQLAEVMIAHSSNLATNNLIDMLGPLNVRQYMHDLQVKGLDVKRGVGDMVAYEKGVNNSVQAYDMMQLMEWIGRKTLISKPVSGEMMDMLEKQTFNEIIPKYLPDSLTVAHKTGEISTVTHDAAVVSFPSGHSYVLVILAGEIKENKEEVKELMAQISKKVFEYELGRNK